MYSFLAMVVTQNATASSNTESLIAFVVAEVVLIATVVFVFNR